MAKKRSTRQQVIEGVLRIKALVDAGETIENAARKVGVSRNAYDTWRKRGFKFPGVNIDSGSVSASSLPPRPGKGGKRPPKPVDMDNIESIAKRLTKVNRMINDVKVLTEERKRLSTRLMHLLKG
jgi:transposase-like protein